MTTRSDLSSRTAVVTVAVAGAGPDGVPVDGAAPEACEGVAARAEEGFGPVHGRLDGAFAGVVTPFADAAAAEFRRVAELTYLGCVNGTRAALHRMLPRDRGTVVQVGPAIAHRRIPPARPADGPPSAEDRVRPRPWRPADGGRGPRPWAARHLGHHDPPAPARGAPGCRP
ncbi:SDR family NAD(P)-dependent oxidoreductase [Kitasatospora sp. NPDC058032]|uniref:SDR family NAD(P)-dependent oxidoreductase n=1 Tax=Kitasatospora sp. NPDC058032 TaxID=3346307 RepID=UPI0036D77DAF